MFHNLQSLQVGPLLKFVHTTHTVKLGVPPESQRQRLWMGLFSHNNWMGPSIGHALRLRVDIVRLIFNSNDVYDRDMLKMKTFTSWLTAKSFKIIDFSHNTLLETSVRTRPKTDWWGKMPVHLRSLHAKDEQVYFRPAATTFKLKHF